MTRYNIYFRKYNIMARAYVPYVKIVETVDIYHAEWWAEVYDLIYKD